MGIENIKKLLDKANEDQNLKEQLKGADADKIIEIAKEYDIVIEPEDFAELSEIMTEEE